MIDTEVERLMRGEDQVPKNLGVRVPEKGKRKESITGWLRRVWKSIRDNATGESLTEEERDELIADIRTW